MKNQITLNTIVGTSYAYVIDIYPSTTDMTFADSHALWVQHPSGAFSQMDLRYCDKPLDSVPRTALTWTPTGSLTFVSDNVEQWEIPYDDV